MDERDHKDPEKAEEIARYRQAVEQGDREAQYCLGRCYEIGDGVEQDYEKAAAYYEQAAEQGQIEAQRCMGVMYERGIGESAQLVPAGCGEKICGWKGTVRIGRYIFRGY